MNPSYLAVIAVTELPLMAMGLGVIVSNYRLHAKALEKMADRVRVVNPPKAQDAATQAQPVNISERRPA